MNAKDINKAFSDFLKEKMEKAMLNQSELARRTGIPQDRISRIVNDESRISLHDFVILCSQLDADFTKDLLGRLGETRYIMSTLEVKNPYLQYFPLAQQMLLNVSDEQHSHPFLQAPSCLEAWSALNSVSIRAFTESKSDLRKPDGVWMPFAFTKNCYTVSDNFKLQ